jgi:hypothetical protein
MTGDHGENDQPRRKSLQLSLLSPPAKNEGKLEPSAKSKSRALTLSRPQMARGGRKSLISGGQPGIVITC